MLLNSIQQYILGKQEILSKDYHIILKVDIVQSIQFYKVIQFLKEPSLIVPGLKFKILKIGGTQAIGQSNKKAPRPTSGKRIH